MEIVCRDTAQKMKDAGFPQPAPEFGQFWYDGDALNCIGFGDFTIHFPEMNMDGYVFAPTTTDILRELGSDYDLSAMNDKIMFMCIRRAGPDQITPKDYWVHKKPAEACANPWLKKYGR